MLGITAGTWWAIGLFVTSLVLTYLTAPKTDNNGLEAGTLEVPDAEEGTAIPVLFGTRNITGTKIVWFGDLKTKAIKKKGGKK